MNRIASRWAPWFTILASMGVTCCALIILGGWYQDGKLAEVEAILGGCGALILCLLAALYTNKTDEYSRNRERDKQEATGMVSDLETKTNIAYQALRHDMKAREVAAEEFKHEVKREFSEIKMEMKKDASALEKLKDEVMEIKQEMVTKEDLKDAIRPLHDLILQLIRRE